MPLPEFNENGDLPPGIHDATLEQIAERFAQSSVRRSLWNEILRYVAELRHWPLAEELLVDGSFVTSEPTPHDIDIILVFRGDYDLAPEVSPFEYNLRSHRMVKRNYGLDLIAVRANSLERERFVALFSQVCGRPDLVKGIVRVQLWLETRPI
jgi:hypothetical protein